MEDWGAVCRGEVKQSLSEGVQGQVWGHTETDAHQVPAFSSFRPSHVLLFFQNANSADQSDPPHPPQMFGRRPTEGGTSCHPLYELPFAVSFWQLDMPDQLITRASGSQFVTSQILQFPF